MAQPGASRRSGGDLDHATARDASTSRTCTPIGCASRHRACRRNRRTFSGSRSRLRLRLRDPVLHVSVASRPSILILRPLVVGHARRVLVHRVTHRVSSCAPATLALDRASHGANGNAQAKRRPFGFLLFVSDRHGRRHISPSRKTRVSRRRCGVTRERGGEAGTTNMVVFGGLYALVDSDDELGRPFTLDKPIVPPTVAFLTPGRGRLCTTSACARRWMRSTRGSASSSASCRTS